MHPSSLLWLLTGGIPRGCWTKDLSSPLDFWPEAPSVPCHVGLRTGQFITRKLGSSEQARESEGERVQARGQSALYNLVSLSDIITSAVFCSLVASH